MKTEYDTGLSITCTHSVNSQDLQGSYLIVGNKLYYRMNSFGICNVVHMKMNKFKMKSSKFAGEL